MAERGVCRITRPPFRRCGYANSDRIIELPSSTSSQSESFRESGLPLVEPGIAVNSCVPCVTKAADSLATGPRDRDRCPAGLPNYDERVSTAIWRPLLPLCDLQTSAASEQRLRILVKSAMSFAPQRSKHVGSSTRGSSASDAPAPPTGRGVALVSPSWPPSASSNGIVSYVACLNEELEKQNCSPVIVTNNGDQVDGIVLVPP